MERAIEPIRDIELLESEEPKKRKLTAKEQFFIDTYLECGNATEAAMQIYNCSTRRVASVVASRVLSRVNVQELLEERSSRAALRIERLADKAKSEKVRLDANKDILDRAGYKARDHVQVEHTFSLVGLAKKREMLNGNADVIEQIVNKEEGRHD